MPYKDKEKARIAARERQRKSRAKGVTKGVTNEGVTQGVTAEAERLISKAKTHKPRAGKDWKLQGIKLTGGYDTGPDLAIQARLGKHTEQGNIRVAKPGDPEHPKQHVHCVPMVSYVLPKETG